MQEEDLGFIDTEILITDKIIIKIIKICLIDFLYFYQQ